MQKEIIKSKKKKQPIPPSDFLRIRCPNCSKLFSVNKEHILETRPEFSCTTCKTLFWISYPECLEKEEVLGTRSASETLSQKEALKTLQAQNLKNTVYQLPTCNCPKCKALFKWGEKECLKCGLIFSKHNKKEKISADSEIQKLWKDIIKDYENEDLHQKFLETCRTKNHSAYALHKYKELLSVQPGDLLSQKYLKQSQDLEPFPFSKKTSSPMRKKKLLTLNLLLGISVGLVITGFIIPPLINLVGLGISLMFFSLALHYYFQHSRGL